MKGNNCLFSHFTLLLFWALAATPLTNTWAQITEPYLSQKKLIPVQVAAQRLDQALQQLSKQLGCPIAYDYKAVKSFHSPPLQGKMLPADAVVQLVRGSGLEAHLTKQGLAVDCSDQDLIHRTANQLQLQVEQAVKSGKLKHTEAYPYLRSLQQVRKSAKELAREQGFISAAEKASYERSFAQVRGSLQRI